MDELRVKLMSRQELVDVEDWTTAALAEGGEVVLPAELMGRLLGHVAAIEMLYEGVVGDWCLACGCHEADACDEGCSWANADHTLCTACAVEDRCER